MPRHTAEFARHPLLIPDPRPSGMSATSAPPLQARWSPALGVRLGITLLASGLTGWALVGFFTGRLPLAPGLPLTGATLVAAGMIARRYGIALPGNGFSSYILGVMLLALLDGGWAFAAVVAPLTMALGDLFLRRLPVAAAVGNAAHLTAGTALLGMGYERLGGATGAAALAPANLVPVSVLAFLLPLVVNGSFYLELAVGRTLAWVDARLTVRWEAIVYLTSAGLALAWLALAHSGAPGLAVALMAVAIGTATAGSVYVIRKAVRADELQLVQGLAQAIAAEINLTKNFERIQDLTRRLVPWEQMGFARYDAHTNEMELVADTAAGGRTSFRFDANAGLTGEAVRLRRPVVAHALRPDQVVVPGGERPGAEVLVPLYHAGQLVGLGGVRPSDPLMDREPDGEVLALPAPQPALMPAIEASVQPVVGASERTTSYIETLTATTQQIHASSQEVAAAAQRASHGAQQAASLVSAVTRESDQLKQHAGEVATAGDQTRESGAEMEKTTDKVRHATEDAVRRLTELGVTTAQSASEVRRLRDVAEQVEKFSETIGFIANQTNLLALNATIEAARAGVHGRGFAVVADEVHKLAEASGREARAVGKSAQDTRGALDQAAQLLERVREDLTEVVQGSSAWVADLSQIAAAATGTARAGKRVAELARGIADLSGRIGTSLGQARVGAQASAAEAEAVAAAATEQLKAIG